MKEHDEHGKQQSLKCKMDEVLGVYSEVFSAKSSVEGGQDGGVATALLVSGLQRSAFDCAVVVQRKHGYLAEAVAAETVDDVLKARGTKYLRVNTVFKLKELVEGGYRRIAVVGTPCQVRAARKLQSALLRSYPDLELTLIGLFCFEAFKYEKLKEETRRLLAVDLDAAEKTQIRRSKIVVRVDGKDNSMSVKELKAAVENACHHCSDFTAEYADISVGSVGSDEGYSTVIVRSPMGQKLVGNLDLNRGNVRKEEIVRLAALKRKRALNT